MRISDLIEATTPYVQKLVDPALMTFREYYRMANKADKFHDSGAYQTNLKKMNQMGYTKKSQFPTLLNQISRNGLRFEIRKQTLDKFASRKWVKTDENGSIIRDKQGEPIYYSLEELEADPSRASRRYEYLFAIFNEQAQCVGIVQDEWGCVLITVADEYQGFGFGPVLVNLARRAEPDKTSGGFTPAGYANFVKVYREMVREYVSSGMYSFLVRSGQITMERAREIIASADLGVRPKTYTDSDLNNHNTADWMFYAQDGAFIIYDKKLAKIINDTRYEHFADQMLLGMIYASGMNEHTAETIHSFGGVSDKMRQFLLRCALSQAGEDQRGVYLTDEALPAAQQEGIEIKPRPGYPPIAYLTGKPINYVHLALVEQRWRKSFDQYDEFRIQMLEMAVAKFRGW